MPLLAPIIELTYLPLVALIIESTRLPLVALIIELTPSLLVEPIPLPFNSIQAEPFEESKYNVDTNINVLFHGTNPAASVQSNT